jgi:uncharacterized lipoprotein YddW (UPF0748 family)
MKQIGAASVALAVIVGLGAARAADEMRGLWVVRTSLASRASIEKLVADARDGGVGALFVQVRGRGDAYYASAIEPRGAGLARQPASFDPLAILITSAHAAGLQVHAWVNASLVASSRDLPRDALHVVRRHPEWLMVPRELAPELRSVNPRSPAYVARIAQWTRAQSSDIEGLFVTPLHPEAATHLVDVVSDLVGRYELDGLHLDYLRYPSVDFDYSSTALMQFRESLIQELADPERARLDARLATNPFIYTEMFPARWAAFRRSRLTALVMRIRTAMSQLRPGAVLSVAVIADQARALDDRFQDWPAWAQHGLVDAICPMAYTADPELFANLVADAVRVRGPAAVWAGIGAFRLTPPQSAANVATARRIGSSGYVLFSYDGLAQAGSTPTSYLTALQRAIAMSPSPATTHR